VFLQLETARERERKVKNFSFKEKSATQHFFCSPGVVLLSSIAFSLSLSLRLYHFNPQRQEQRILSNAKKAQTAMVSKRLLVFEPF